MLFLTPFICFHTYGFFSSNNNKKSSVKTSNSQVVAAPLKLLPNTKLVEENDSLKKLCTFMLQHNKVSCLQFFKCRIKKFTVCLLINSLGSKLPIQLHIGVNQAFRSSFFHIKEKKFLYFAEKPNFCTIIVGRRVSFSTSNGFAVVFLLFCAFLLQLKLVHESN